jgi:hypothetical protein
MAGEMTQGSEFGRRRLIGPGRKTTPTLGEAAVALDLIPDPARPGEMKGEWTMTKTTKSYKATCLGEDMGIFQPIRLESGRPAYQGIDPTSEKLLGILWSDGRYDAASRNGNQSWELCEETPAHRQILRAASAPWDPCPMEFVAVSAE